jgi:hypothetical protein
MTEKLKNMKPFMNRETDFPNFRSPKETAYPKIYYSSLSLFRCFDFSS